MFKHTCAFGASAVLLMAAGCGDDNTRPGSDTFNTDTTDTETTCTPTAVVPQEVTVGWADSSGDPIASAFVEYPNPAARFVRTPHLALSDSTNGGWIGGFAIETVAKLDAGGDPTASFESCSNFSNLGDCADVNAPLSFETRPGDKLRLTVTWRAPVGTLGCFTPPSAPTTLDVVVPADTHETATTATTRSVAAHRTTDGVLWFGLLGHGLVGLNPDSDWTRYYAVPTSEPWSATETRPQTPLLFAIEDAGDGALWIGGATTGVSWFDPGADLMDHGDDRWAHAQPTTIADDPLKELAETTIAIAPVADGSLWVASLSGLHHITSDAANLQMTTVAAGAYLAVTTDATGAAWAGRSVEPKILEKWNAELADRWPEAALLEVRTNEAGEATVTPWNLGLTAVTAVSVIGDKVYIGTPDGLHVVDTTTPNTAPVAVAATTLGGLAITGLSSDPRGLWVAARSECAADAGRLVLIDVAGTDHAVLQDASAVGFGTRDFNALKRLSNGHLFVSTVVPRSGLVDLSSAECEPVAITEYAAGDAFIYDPMSEAAPVAIKP